MDTFEAGLTLTSIVSDTIDASAVFGAGITVTLVDVFENREELKSNRFSL